MLRLLIGFFCAFFAVAAVAEEPRVEVEFKENAAIPGQSLVLRITVLVPTWLPKPVVFPSFEAPNVLVRLPESATGPTSKTVDGESWSGVTRRLSITPMVPGSFEIPAQDLIVTWAEPGQMDPLEKTITLDAIRIEGILPEGADDLDPFLAAESLKLSSEGGDAEMPLKAGDSVSLTVTAKIEGAPSMFLPDLIPPVNIDGVAAYRDEPVLADQENRGKSSGTRTEKLTLVAESGGSGSVPDISLPWYNIKTKKVETATIAGLDVTVDAPKAVGQGIPTRLLVAYALLGLVVLLVVFLLARWGAPRVRHWHAARRDRIIHSEPYAFEQLKAAIKAQDMRGLYQALDLWAVRMPTDPRGQDSLQSALCALGKARYGAEAARDQAAWQEVRTAVSTTRSALLHATARSAQLPPLNPRDVAL